MKEVLSPRPDIKIIHTFRSKVLGICFLNGKLAVATERGVYVQSKEGGRWRKLKPKL